jgi:hypothetical protein
MTSATQMIAETLNGLKGWPRPLAVDFAAKIDSSVTDRLPPGTVAHVSDAGTYLPGVGDLNVMPLFLFQASDDPDVSNYGGDAATDRGVWVPITPSGAVMGLVAIGAYELVTTNYDDQVDYNPNDMLTSPTTTGGGINAGMLTQGTLGTNLICGVVSRGIVDNGYGYNALAFWPVMFPVYP